MTMAGQIVEVSPQVEEYLEAVCRIRDRSEHATLTELAHELSVAPPSALGMLRRMKDQGLLDYSRRTGAVLTATGQRRADTLRRRHRLAERLLTDLLGMPWELAHDVACRFEHVIDEEVEDYLTTALHHPTTCPHGNPLDAQASLPQQPLTALAAGQLGRLCRILDESAPTLAYLREMRLQPGVAVLVCAIAPFDGPLTVEVAGERFALSRSMAERLYVAFEEAVA